MTESKSPAGDRTWHYALAGAMLLAGPIARSLYYDRYPLGRPEAAILIGGLALAGALLAAGSFRLNRYLSDLVFALLLLVYLDLDFNPDRFLPVELVPLGCLVVADLFRRRRASIACVVLAAFYLTSLPSRTPDDRVILHQPTGRPDTSLVPIVHVVLDEHLGVGGFRAMGDTATANFLADFFTRWGFDLYEGAYSRFYFTQNSVPAILSLGLARESDIIKRVGRPPYPLAANPYFSRLVSRGYDVNVYESANLQFCETPGVPVSTCVQVPPNSVANIGYMNVGTWERGFLVVEYYLRHASALVARFHRWLPPLERRRLFAGRGMTLLDRAGHDILSRRRRSDFVFIHLLLPHSPYEVNERCEPYPHTLRPAQVPMFGRLPDSLIALRWARYRLQVRCTYLLMDRFLDRVDAAYGRDQAIIIVHGDHGARGTPVGPSDGRLAAFRTMDLNAGFSTVLAVRYPGSAGRVHLEPVPLQDFFWGFAKSGFAALPSSDWQHFVYSTSTDNSGPWTMRSLGPGEMPWASVAEPEPKPLRPRGSAPVAGGRSGHSH